MADILKIEDGVLKECTDKSITSVVIPDSVTKIGSGAFRDVKCLKSVVIPDSVAEIGASAFMDCESLTEIKIGRGVKIIGERVFMGTALISLVLPGGNSNTMNTDTAKIPAGTKSMNLKQSATSTQKRAQSAIFLRTSCMSG